MPEVVSITSARDQLHVNRNPNVLVHLSGNYGETCKGCYYVGYGNMICT